MELSILLACALLAAWQVLHLAMFVRWSDSQTRSSHYYSRSHGERRRFKQRMRMHALLLSPILTLLGGMSRSRFSQRSIVYAGVAGPAGACSADSFRRAAEYQPRREDVFVVTQMRSGTTWMQHLVYQVLTRGAGDLTCDGQALNAISPWIESIRTVGIDEAPLVGDRRPSRIIKTHLPAALCPFNRQARYIYVARHPLACFASCADFVRGNLQGFAPDWPELARWFQSDELMWWQSWVTHVGGWQSRAESESNVLLVRYEEMTSNLAAVAQQVASFLDVPPLTDSELASITHKCSLEYMRTHADAFEMHPPHLLQTANPFFRHGGHDRGRSVPREIAREILAWCRAASSRGLPLERLYPDLATNPPAA
jgi:hypothetical protein